MPEIHKTVFISYRRKPAAFIARAIFEHLKNHGYDVFMDVESIDAGDFKRIIENQVKARAHFLVVLTSGTISKFDNPTDMMRHEIEYAMEHERNIVPLLINDFKFNRTTLKFLTGKLDELPNFNGLKVPHEYFDEAMERLRERFLNKAVEVLVSTTPASDSAEVQRTLAGVEAEPVPTVNELSAEEYFDLAMALNDNSSQEIIYYDEAIRLNPQYIEAYNNRGIARRNSGDFKGALEDFNISIRLDPRDTSAYLNRGDARYHLGDFSGAIEDNNTVIQLDPQDNAGYNNRGEVLFVLGKYEQALDDFQVSNNQDPDDKWPIAGLAITQYMLKKDYEAGRIWRELVDQDARYGEADWVGQELHWRPELVEAARKLIATL